jgi:hypothetical protein
MIYYYSSLASRYYSHRMMYYGFNVQHIPSHPNSLLFYFILTNIKSKGFHKSQFFIYLDFQTLKLINQYKKSKFLQYPDSDIIYNIKDPFLSDCEHSFLNKYYL